MASTNALGASPAQAQQQQQGQQPPSKEDLIKLKEALEKLGQQLEGQGGLRNEQGEPIIEIKEPLEEEGRQQGSGSGTSTADAAGAPHGQAGTSGGATTAASTEAETSGSSGGHAKASRAAVATADGVRRAGRRVHWGDEDEEAAWQALMRRMDQLQLMEEQAEAEAAAGSTGKGRLRSPVPPAQTQPIAAAAAAEAAAPSNSSSSTSQGGPAATLAATGGPVGKASSSSGSSGFKSGFLLGKSLDGASPLQPAGRGAAAGRRPHWTALAKANPAFTGTVVERSGGEVLPALAAPVEPPAAAGAGGRTAAPQVTQAAAALAPTPATASSSSSSSGTGTKLEAAEPQASAPDEAGKAAQGRAVRFAEEPEVHGMEESEAGPRVSRFKQRRQGQAV